MPAHDAALAGDTLYQIQFNFEWREIVASALQFYFRHDETALALDNEDLLNNVLLDLYTADVVHNLNWKPIRKQLPADFATTSVTFVTVTNSGITFTVTKPNVYVRATFSQVQSNTSGQNFFRIVMDGAIFDVDGLETRTLGLVVRTLSVAARFENVESGLKTFALQFRTSGTNGVVQASMDILWEIMETD